MMANDEQDMHWYKVVHRHIYGMVLLGTNKHPCKDIESTGIDLQSPYGPYQQK